MSSWLFKLFVIIHEVVQGQNLALIFPAMVSFGPCKDGSQEWSKANIYEMRINKNKLSGLVS